MNFFALSCILTAVLTAILGLVVLLSGFKNKTNRAWFLTSFSVFVWTVGLAGTVLVNNQESALFWQRILYIGTVLTPIFFFNFCVTFLAKEKLKRSIVFIGGIVSAFFLLSIFTKLFILEIGDRIHFGYWPVKIGSLYWPFLIYFIFYVSYSMFLLKKDSKKYEGVQQKQIQFIYYAALIGFVGGSTNFLLDFNLDVYPIGNFFVALYIIFISYAVLRHHLFDVKVIATELFTLVIWVFLLVRTLLSETTNDLIINISLLVAVVIFGVLLIRSVIREVRQREKMEQMAKELEKAYGIEKEARVKIQELGEAKTQFIMATQHHLRTPLTSMRGYIDLILTGSYGKVPPKVKNAIFKLQISTVRLLRIVNELLDVSQFQLGKKVVSLQLGVQIEPILKEVLEELRFTAETKGIYLKFQKPEEKMPAIQADVEKLKVVFFNLIDNGLKYTNKGGVTIKLQVSDGRMRIISEDTGIGIPKERLGTLFDSAFERGQEAKKVFSAGRGIGLYVSSQIVKAHNGKVWAESEGAGKGTTFYVELPVG